MCFIYESSTIFCRRCPRPLVVVTVKMKNIFLFCQSPRDVQRMQALLKKPAPVSQLLRSFTSDARDWVKSLQSMLSAAAAAAGKDHNEAETQVALSALTASFKVHGAVALLVRALSRPELMTGDIEQTDTIRGFAYPARYPFVYSSCQNSNL
jgi:hypothetical protein